MPSFFRRFAFSSPVHLCNTDGIFNDDTYDYDNIGLPFLAKLGRAVYEHELKRVRKGKPDLERFRASLR